MSFKDIVYGQYRVMRKVRYFLGDKAIHAV